MMFRQPDTSCPVCGSSEVTPMFDPVLILKQRDDAPVIAYRCSNQHVFLPPQIQSSHAGASIATNPTKVVRRYAIG
jgi:hypothetical protein